MPELIFTEAVAPSTPTTGKLTLYAKTDSLLYIKDDTGTETPLSTPASAGLTQAEVLRRIEA